MQTYLAIRARVGDADHASLALDQLTTPVSCVAESRAQTIHHQHRCGRRWRLARDQRAVERDGEVAPKDLKGDFAFDVQRPRPGQFAVRLKFEKIRPPMFELHASAEVGDEA